jgi:hypothetical protein
MIYKYINRFGLPKLSACKTLIAGLNTLTQTGNDKKSNRYGKTIAISAKPLNCGKRKIK